MNLSACRILLLHEESTGVDEVSVQYVTRLAYHFISKTVLAGFWLTQQTFSALHIRACKRAIQERGGHRWMQRTFQVEIEQLDFSYATIE